MQTPLLPAARADQLLVIEMGEETLVYDLARHRAHCLNPIATLVWRLCDGQTPVEDIAAALAEASRIPVDDDVVWYALRRLNGARLLASPLPPQAAGHRVTRRDLLRRAMAAGVGLVAVPAIATIVAPSTLQAQASCLPLGAPCIRSIGLRCCQGMQCVGAPAGADLGTCK